MPTDDPTPRESLCNGGDKERFAFGVNWLDFLKTIDERKVREAEDSLRTMLEVDSLHGCSFLDIGCGSGLFSLAAHRLGARVVSFDSDPNSVACTKMLREKFPHDANRWDIQHGSVLDNEYLRELGTFDVVYAWGVLHHTGAMWEAMANVDQCVASDGKLFIALYNAQPIASSYWSFVKRMYNAQKLSRLIFVPLHLIYPTIPSVMLRLAQNRAVPRGMNVWHDLIDWLGGYPFEVSSPKQVFDSYKRRGYRLEQLETAGGKSGCNQFVFRKGSA